MTDTDKPQLITGYKAFNKDFTCRKFQYEVGKTYKIEGDIKMCERGFHFCPKSPFDVFSYYLVIDENGEMSRFARVSCPASKAINGDKKIVTAEITIEEEVSFSDLVEAQILDTFVHLNDFSQSFENVASSRLSTTDYGSYLATSGEGSHLAATGEQSDLAATGDYSRLVATGDDSYLVATGEQSSLAATGYDSHLAATGEQSDLATVGSASSLVATGDYSRLAATGDDSHLVATGEQSNLATAGVESSLVATGDYSRLAATGNNSQCIASGQNGVISISGRCGCFKGENGTHVAIADFDEEGKCIGFVTGCIGEDGLKANVWYTVSDGKFVEYKD